MQILSLDEISFYVPKCTDNALEIAFFNNSDCSGSAELDYTFNLTDCLSIREYQSFGVSCFVFPLDTHYWLLIVFCYPILCVQLRLQNKCQY